MTEHTIRLKSGFTPEAAWSTVRQHVRKGFVVRIDLSSLTTPDDLEAFLSLLHDRLLPRVGDWTGPVGALEVRRHGRDVMVYRALEVV